MKIAYVIFFLDIEKACAFHIQVGSQLWHVFGSIVRGGGILPLSTYTQSIVYKPISVEPLLTK